MHTEETPSCSAGNGASSKITTQTDISTGHKGSFLTPQEPSPERLACVRGSTQGLALLDFGRLKSHLNPVMGSTGESGESEMAAVYAATVPS